MRRVQGLSREVGDTYVIMVVLARIPMFATFSKVLARRDLEHNARSRASYAC